MSGDAQYEIIRLREEKDKLRNELLFIEEDHKKAMDAMKIKFDASYFDEI